MVVVVVKLKMSLVIFNHVNVNGKSGFHGHPVTENVELVLDNDAVKAMTVEYTTRNKMKWDFVGKKDAQEVPSLGYYP